MFMRSNLCKDETLSKTAAVSIGLITRVCSSGHIRPSAENYKRTPIITRHKWRNSRTDEIDKDFENIGYTSGDDIHLPMGHAVQPLVVSADR